MSLKLHIKDKSEDKRYLKIGSMAVQWISLTKKDLN